MDIIALRGDMVPEGEFRGDSVVIGATREECIAALSAQAAFAQDVGATLREDGVMIYTIIGGEFV